MPEDDPPGARAHGSRGLDEFLLAETEHDTTDLAGVDRPAQQTEHQRHDQNGVTGVAGRQRRRHHQQRQDQQQVAQTHHDRVDLAADQDR